jgi:putative zinc finger/helix-turn-helix YgiT family protein
MKATAKKCALCGGEMTSRRGPHLYDKTGLRVTLVNVEIRECTKCGDRQVMIPRVLELHELIARSILQKHSPLAPAEIVFLRKHLSWSSEDFARVLGVTRETVSRWENGKLRMSAQADRLLRMLAVSSEPIEDYARHDAAKKVSEIQAAIKSIAEIDDSKEPEALAVSLEATPSWRMVAAA